MRIIIILTVFTVLCLSACSSSNNLNSERHGQPGSDRDIHGCIGTAGYQWCERTTKCERQWELAAENGYANTPENFNLYCHQ